MAADWARWAGQYRLATGKSLAKLSVDQLYDVGVALISVAATVEPRVNENVERVLDSLAPPPQVEQTRRDDGMLEHNPDMEIPGWGFSDPEDMPGPPVSASSGMVDGFDPD